MKIKITPKDRLIFALDVDSKEKAFEFIDLLSGHVGMFKVGNQLFTNCGKEVIERLKKNDSKIFLDLKYHDIPNTVASASIEALRLGVTMFNMHSLGGYDMMKRSVDAVCEESHSLGIKKPIVLAVTILTSMSRECLQGVGINNNMTDQIITLAKLAKKAGVDGVVASPQDVPFIRENTGKDFVIVTPGVRPAWAKKDDHKRLSTPLEAIKNGSDYLVVGRPIKDAENPVLAAKKICGEFEIC